MISPKLVALRTRGSFILNGNRRMKHTGKYKALGSVIDYEILARRKEKIFILGPIEEAVYLSVRDQYSRNSFHAWYHGLICTASDVIFNHTMRILF